MNEWQPIETAPKDGTTVLVGEWIGSSFLCYAASWCEGREYWVSNACADGYYGSPDMTHWMPLPAPPAVEQPVPEYCLRPTDCKTAEWCAENGCHVARAALKD